MDIPHLGFASLLCCHTDFRRCCRRRTGSLAIAAARWWTFWAFPRCRRNQREASAVLLVVLQLHLVDLGIHQLAHEDQVLHVQAVDHLLDEAPVVVGRLHHVLEVVVHGITRAISFCWAALKEADHERA